MRKIDYILYIACAITLAVAMYDIINIDKIQDKADAQMEKCNKHWEEIFRKQCQSVKIAGDPQLKLIDFNTSLELNDLEE